MKQVIVSVKNKGDVNECSTVYVAGESFGWNCWVMLYGGNFFILYNWKKEIPIYETDSKNEIPRNILSGHERAL